MKRILTICLFAFIGSSMVMAQTNSEKLQEKFTEKEIAWAKDRTQQLDNEVGLSQEQKEEIMKINLKYAHEYQNLKAEGASEEKLDKFRDEMFEERISRYGEVLTPDQKAKLKASHDKLKNEETGSDKAERKQEVKEKAAENGMDKEDVKEKKEQKEMKEEKKDEVKEKANDKGMDKEDVKEKKDEKKNDE